MKAHAILSSLDKKEGEETRIQTGLYKNTTFQMTLTILLT